MRYNIRMEFQTPQKSINRSFLKTPVTQAQIDLFKKNFATMTAQAKTGESEENYKNIIAAFLKNTWYGDCYINTKDRIDLAIFNGQTADSGKPAVLIEVKAPQNKGEMVSVGNFNAKAFHESVLYFMDEREKHANNEMRYVILTNYDEWFLIDAKKFLDCVAGDRRVKDIYKKFTAGQLTDTRTETFYEEIKRLNLHEHEKLSATHFTLADIATAIAEADAGDSKKLVALYKMLSPETLLSRPFANDSNSMDTGFYSELLHIIGLEETSEGGKKLIGRVQKNKRQDASLFESAMYQLEEKISGEEKREEVAMRLVITWVNRLLFLKLLEAQQLSYQNGDKAYRFLDIGFIKDFDELNELFFKVLARKTSERHSSIAEKYSKIPYLNSSLFEMTEDESDFIRISELKASELAVYGGTVLKTHDGRKLTGRLDTLKYIFQFLDAYNFASEGNAEIQADTKTLINASVLGLIFEKINGYKDGSFFTPGFITQYMAHEAVSRAVVQKFNEVKNWRCESLKDVDNEISDRKEASGIIDTIRICDPAVGSGHFLVSCLNEMVAIKAQLGLLFAPDGSRIKPSDWQITVENDELSVTDDEGALYAYNPKNAANRRVQEALFAEKKTIIENCLFGVDINPNSVNICRLRLWIELLKNACYTEASGYTELETLPNIDINIKCGNSLVSKFAVQVGKGISKNGEAETDSKELKESISEYKKAVSQYKNENDKDSKNKVRKSIAQIKNRLHGIYQLDLFDSEQNTRAQESDLYKNSMEWMIEFPETLDENGSFMGFDIVIGNPPYGIFNKKQNQKVGLATDAVVLDIIKSSFPEADEGMINAAKVFFALAFRLGTRKGFVSMIIPFGILADTSSVKIRKHIFANHTFLRIDAFPERDSTSRRVFTDAKMSTCIIFSANEKIDCNMDVGVSFEKSISKVRSEFSVADIQKFSPEKMQIPMCNRKVFDLLMKLKSNTTLKCFKDIAPSIEGEVHMTKCKPAITSNSEKYQFLKGAQISKWYYKTDKSEISQGEIEFIDLNILKTVCSDEKIKNSTHERIVFQRLTGINEKYRLKATLIPKKIFIANSVNNLKHQTEYPLKYLLGLFNSSLLNFIFKATSTSSNVNGYEVDALPFYPATPEQQQAIVALVDKILAVKDGDHNADTSEWEKQIDLLVYELYGLTFEEAKVIGPELTEDDFDGAE